MELVVHRRVVMGTSGGSLCGVVRIQVAAMVDSASMGMGAVDVDICKVQGKCNGWHIVRRIEGI
jgi:hypothetical protein